MYVLHTTFPLVCHSQKDQFKHTHTHTHTQKPLILTQPIDLEPARCRFTYLHRYTEKPCSLTHTRWPILYMSQFRSTCPLHVSRCALISSLSINYLSNTSVRCYHYVQCVFGGWHGHSVMKFTDHRITCISESSQAS